MMRMHCRHAGCTYLRLADMCGITTRESNEQPFSAQRMKAGCITAGHLRTQNASHMICNAWQARRARTGRLGTTTEACARHHIQTKSIESTCAHRCNGREQDTAEQSRCMTHDVCTYRAGRQVRVRTVRGVRSMTARCDKRRSLRARGPHRCAERGQDTPSRQGA